MSLSLFMIVKNEEKHLRKCLSSINDIVDEIIIVDTGSDDNSINIAREFNAVIFHYKWHDDFSAARNFALSKCTSDWVIYLDADEELKSGSKAELKRITANNEKTGYYLSVISVDQFQDYNQSMLFIRLFKNEPGVVFENKVHEQIINSLRKNNYQFKNSTLVIYHYGYNIDKEAKQDKARRNLDIMLKEFEEVKSPFYAFHLGHSYNILENYENAIKYFLIAIEGNTLSPSKNCEIYNTLAYIHHTLKKEEMALNYFTEAFKINPKSPYANYIASKIYYSIGDLKKAEEFCRLASENNKLQQFPDFENDTNESLTDEELWYYGISLGLINKNGESIKYFLSLIEIRFRELFPTDYQERMNIMIRLLSNKEIDRINKELLFGIVSKYNISLIFSLLARTVDYSLCYNFMVEMYPRFSEILLQNERFHPICSNIVLGLKSIALEKEAELLLSIVRGRG